MTHENGMVQAVFDAIPALLLVVDDDVRIQACNQAAAWFLEAEGAPVLRRRGGEVLHCLHAADDPGGCGHGAHCRRCVIRRAVGDALGGERAVRRRTRLEILRHGVRSEIYALITASPFQYRGRSLVLLVIEDISQVAELHRLIPICAVCKQIRDEQASWSRLEAYFKAHWDVNFSHGLCPVCLAAEMEKIDAGADPAAQA